MLTLHFIFHLLDHKNISKIKFYATTKQCQNKFLVFCALCNDGMHYAMMVVSIVVPPVCENADTCSSVSVTTSVVSGVSGVHWWYTSVQTEHSLLFPPVTQDQDYTHCFLHFHSWSTFHHIMNNFYEDVLGFMFIYLHQNYVTLK